MQGNKSTKKGSEKGHSPIVRLCNIARMRAQLDDTRKITRNGIEESGAQAHRLWKVTQSQQDYKPVAGPVLTYTGQQRILECAIAGRGAADSLSRG